MPDDAETCERCGQPRDAHEVIKYSDGVERIVSCPDVELSKGIVVNPGRCGGKPTVKGTRITAEMVAHLMSGTTALTPEQIVDSYPALTYGDISNVVAWWSRDRTVQIAAAQNVAS